MTTRHRFFVAPADVTGDSFPMPATIQRQVRTVLRLGDGERIVLLAGDGDELTCRLEGGNCVVEERRRAAGEPRHRLTVAQALLRGDALEEVVRQGTEIGVSAFRLFVSERCVARSISAGRIERLRAIARESAEQSERGVVPDIEDPVPLTAAISAGSVLLLEREGGRGLGEIASADPPAMIVIGPEGGFSPSEVEAAERAGAVPAGLGPRILRSRTVATAAAAVILSRTGDFA